MALERGEIERLARRVVELLGEEAVESRQRGELVDAAAVARLLGVSRATVYAKADELGVVRVGNGKRARLRFDPEQILAGPAKESNGSAEPAPRRRRASGTSQRPNSELLPIRGRRIRSARPLRS